MNLPNSLTITRMFLIPLLVVVLLTEFEGRMVLGVRKEFVGAAIFAVASLTDWLDGYLARRRKQVTALGQVMDPLADKLLISAALVSLVQMGLAPAWMVAVIIGREFAVTVLRSLAYNRGIVMPASPMGKLKMTAQVVAVLALILSTGTWQQLAVVGELALWVVVVTALASGWDYYREFARTPVKAGQASQTVKTADFVSARERRGRSAADLASGGDEVVPRDRVGGLNNLNH